MYWTIRPENGRERLVDHMQTCRRCAFFQNGRRVTCIDCDRITAMLFMTKEQHHAIVVSFLKITQLYLKPQTCAMGLICFQKRNTHFEHILHNPRLWSGCLELLPSQSNAREYSEQHQARKEGTRTYMYELPVPTLACRQPG